MVGLSGRSTQPTENLSLFKPRMLCIPPSFWLILRYNPCMDFKIEPASWKDLGDLRALEKDCFPQDAWPLLDLVAVLTFPNVVRFKVSVDGRMVGFAAGDPRYADKVGWVTTIGILSEYRRTGMGKVLLTVTEQAMQTPVVRLCVRRSNEPALQMYDRAGYEIVDIWERYYIGGEDALVLEKRLDVKPV